MYVVTLFNYVFLGIGITLTASSKSNKSDYDEDLPYRYYLSTKTPYRFIENKDDSEIKYERCYPSRIWAVYRHGTRTPGPETTDAAQSRLIEIRDAIVNNNKNSGNIANWEPHNELDDKKRLTRMGEEEMRLLGRRLKNRFASLLPENWNNETFWIRATDTTRTQASARNFLIGLFDENEVNRIWMPTPLKKDPILRFYKLCPRWREQVKKNPVTKKEVKKFVDSKPFSKVVESVTKKANLQKGFLSVEDIQLMYTICCFETSWDRDRESAWCKLFDKDDFKVLEYAEDLEYFWIDGFGNNLTTQIACPMFRDAFHHLNTEQEKPFVFYFTHSGTILKFLAHLGLYRDELDLKSKNFKKHNSRKWRTSKIDSFASNIVFVRYDCDNDEKYILTLHQERPVRLPGCPADSDLCGLNIIEKLYKNSLNDCDYDSICTEKSENESTYWLSWVDFFWNSFDSLRRLYFY